MAQLDVIETMTPVQFLEFRDRLESASGFQSGQFRELEAILGRRDPGVLDSYHEGGVDYDRVKAAMARPSVYDSFLHYLAARGYDVPEEILQRDVTQPVEESAGVQAALLGPTATTASRRRSPSGWSTSTRGSWSGGTTT